MSSTAITNVSNTLHIFVFPYPAQGHMLPLLDLTHQLALHGLKITILVTPKNLPFLNRLLSAQPNLIQPLVLPFPTHPNLPLGVENIKDIGNSGNNPIILALSKLEGEVIQWFKSHPSPPKAILSDFFLGFTNHWAKQLEIPRIAFFSSGAFLSSLLDHVLQNVQTLQDVQSVEFPKLPRSPTFAEEHLPTIFRVRNGGNTSWNTVKDYMLENFRSWGLVFNSFYALEGEYLDYIKQEVGHNRVYGVGPLSSLGLTRSDPVPSTSNNNVLNWLDKNPDGSVLYVCFGSQKMLTRPQMEALALGLERSGTRFIWVVKAEASELVPGGFSDRVGDRGVVVHGWVPQVEILTHKGVGGFVSHCGWNSMLESIVAGVLVLAWPLEADQFVNARLLVEFLGSGVRLCEGQCKVPDPDVLATIMGQSCGNDVAPKVRAKIFRDKAFKAVESGGSSLTDLIELVQELNKLVAK